MMQIARRSFLASLGTIFSTSMMARQCLTSQDSVNWDYFTDFNAFRWDLSTPWLANEKTVATDGRILFAANELHPLFDDTAETKRPGIDVLPWNDFDEMVGWQSSDSLVRCFPVYEPKYDNQQPCSICKGTGRVGFGVKKTRKQDEYGDLYECFVGGQVCAVCNGEVWTHESFAFKTNESTFAGHYVERIKSMGDFDFVIQQIHARRESELADVMLFRNALGCGFLMSVDL